MRIILFVFLSFFLVSDPNLDTLKNYKINDSAVFNGVRENKSSYKTYKGEIIDNQFKRTKGLFDENFVPINVRMVVGFSSDNSDTSYLDRDRFENHNGKLGLHWIESTYETDGDYYVSYCDTRRNHVLFVKRFSPHDDKWEIYDNLLNAENGYSVEKTVHIFSYDSKKNLIENDEADGIGLFHSLIVVWGIVMILYSINLMHVFRKKLKISLAIIIGVLFLIFFFVFLDFFIRCQIVNAILLVTIPMSIALCTKKTIVVVLFGPLLLLSNDKKISCNDVNI